MSRIRRRLQPAGRSNPPYAGRRIADDGRDFVRPVEVPTRCQVRFAGGPGLQSRNNGRLDARLISLIKDYRTVSPNTGTISQKLLECGFMGHLVDSVDLGDQAKEKWRQRNGSNHGK